MNITAIGLAGVAFVAPLAVDELPDDELPMQSAYVQTIQHWPQPVITGAALWIPGYRKCPELTASIGRLEVSGNGGPQSIFQSG